MEKWVLLKQPYLTAAERTQKAAFNMLDIASLLRLILFVLQRGRLIKILMQYAFPKEHLPSYLGQIRTESNVPGEQSLLTNKTEGHPNSGRGKWVNHTGTEC